MEKTFTRELGSLEGVFAFLSEFAGAKQLDESVVYVVNLVVEELFTNMVKYSPDGDPEIPIKLDADDKRLVIKLVDRNVARFDITQDRSAAADKRLKDRTPGGLGLHLIRQMVDEIDYVYRDGNSEITVVKNLEP